MHYFINYCLLKNGNIHNIRNVCILLLYIMKYTLNKAIICGNIQLYQHIWASYFYPVLALIYFNMASEDVDN